MALPAFVLPALLGAALGGSTSVQTTVTNTASNQVAANPVNSINIGGSTGAYPSGGVSGNPYASATASQTTGQPGGLPSFGLGGAGIGGDYAAAPIQGGDIGSLIQDNILLIAIGAGALFFMNRKA